MSVETVLLDFRVPGCTDTSICARDVGKVASCVAEYLDQECVEKGSIASGTSYTVFYSGPHDCLVTIKHYAGAGLITLSLEILKTSLQLNDELLSYSSVKVLKKTIIKELGINQDDRKVLPACKRLLSKSIISFGEKKVVEYNLGPDNFDKLLFSEVSPWQLVEVFSVPDFGNMLVIDGDVNLAESDTHYTHSLMSKGSMSYKDKDVLILGGGDGALLWELLQEEEKPKFVTMVDLDETVIRACREWMSSTNGGIMDNLEGENYKIIIGDAFKFLKTAKSEGRRFDVIFGDLTTLPVHQGGEDWDFVRSIVTESLSNLRVGGQYLTHCNSHQETASLQLFEELLKSLDTPLEFRSTKAFVPSFVDWWVFYQVTKTGEKKDH